MTTHATSEKHWTTAELNKLATEKGFRLRGLEATRLDTFIDAAFAFVLTLLVISFDDIPSNYAEMLEAIKKIPAFFASFSLLMMFWLQHRRWSRRYGLENNQAILMSLALIFVVLVYVYPLRMIFEAMFHELSNGYLTASFQIEAFNELRAMFVYYSTGFLLMAFIIGALYNTALRSSALLCLDQIELEQTKTGRNLWLVTASFGLLSILLALVLPDNLLPLAGYLYFVLVPLLFVERFIARRRQPPANTGQ